MTATRFATVLIALTPAIANAICGQSLPAPDVRNTTVSMIVTIKSAEMVDSVSSLRDRRPYRINYTFDVTERFRGDPAAVTGLYSIELYHDPKARPWTMAESATYSPGDSVLVLADSAGEVQLGFCGPSGHVDWSRNKVKLLRKGL